MHALPGGEKVHWIDGMWVEGDALRIAEKINEYDPNLRVQYLEHAATLKEPPFRVVEMCRDGIERTVMYAWTLDDRLYDRVTLSDTFHRDIEKELDKANEKARQDIKKEGKEKLEDAKERAEAVFGSPKDNYTMVDEATGKKLKFSSTSPVTSVEKKIISYKE